MKLNTQKKGLTLIGKWFNPFYFSLIFTVKRNESFIVDLPAGTIWQKNIAPV